MSSVRTATTPPPAAIPVGRGFTLWLGGLSGSLLGDAVLYFALGWVASASGGSLAAAVLTAVTVPRAVLLLFGGALADRIGARRVMIVGDGVMVLVTLIAAGWWSRNVGSAGLLIAIGLCVGTVDAFYLPASSSMPRRLVPDRAVPRAMAMRQVVGRIVVLGGAPLGGVLVAAAGLSGALLFDAATFVVMFGVLCFVRMPEPAKKPAGRKILLEIGDGLRFVGRDRVLRPALIMVGVVAGFLIPITSLMVALLGRQAGWDSRTAGLVVGTAAGLSMLVAVIALSRGTFPRAGLVSALGLLAAGLGVLLLALAGTVALSIAGSAVIGLGTGVFATHIGPLVLRTAADEQLSRVQSISILVQTLPLLVTNNLLGFWSDQAGARSAAVGCGLVTVAAGLYGCLNRSLRTVVFS